MCESLTFIFNHLLRCHQAGDPAATRLLIACVEVTLDAAEGEDAQQRQNARCWLKAHTGIVREVARVHERSRAWLRANGFAVPEPFNRSLGPHVRPPG